MELFSRFSREIRIPTCKLYYLLYESIHENTRARLRKTRDRNPRYSVMALACPGWIYARPRDKDDSDNTILLYLPAGVPPSFLIPRGTTDFVRSYRCWWFQVSPLKRRHNRDPCTCRRKCAGGTFAPELHGICPCKATGVIESTLMLGGDASHRFLSFFFFQVINHRFQKPDVNTACSGSSYSILIL